MTTDHHAAAGHWRSVAADAARRLPTRVHRWVPFEQRVDLRHRLGRYLPWEEGYPLTPPEPAPGEHTGPPEYVGVGGSLTGAGWWHRLITDHPGVWSRPDLPPARHFLAHFATEPFGPEEVGRYHGWFPRRVGTIAGEWTPSYASLPWVPALLAEAAPDARVLMMVRDPVERLRLALARGTERRTSQAGTAIADAFDRGFYGAQLAQLLVHVPRHQVLVLQHERCRADLDGQLAATYRFLGLDDTHRPARRYAGMSSTSAGGGDLDADTRSRLVDLYAADVAELSALDPGLDLSLWPDFLPT